MLTGDLCCFCGQHAERRTPVATIEREDETHTSAYACVPCAREFADTGTAPEWVVQDLAELAGLSGWGCDDAARPAPTRR